MKAIQIRDVPEPVHRALKARAAAEGKSLSEYLLQELERLASLPTLAEMMDRLAQLEPVDISVRDIVKIIREGRGR